jgi:hypothetical protein
MDAHTGGADARRHRPRQRFVKLCKALSALLQLLLRLNLRRMRRVLAVLTAANNVQMRNGDRARARSVATLQRGDNALKNGLLIVNVAIVGVAVVAIAAFSAGASGC